MNGPALIEVACEPGKIAVPRAAYVHVPFCRHRCGYCNFTLVAGRDDLVERYLDAMEHELAMTDPVEGSGPFAVDTLYFGGGTPSQLSLGAFRRLAKSVLHAHPLERGHEWTVEVNPAEVRPPFVELLAELGVTRLSLGAQSFRDGKLALLERDHIAADIERSVALALAAGLAVSLDLIFAAPGESLAEWSDDVERAIALQPEHVSTYGLTFERGTAFYRRRLHDELIAVEESLEREMYALAIDRLTAAGFEHYEVSNFARAGQRSRHNETYWSGNGYFAYGPGAARYVNGVRETNHRSTTTYLRRMGNGESPVAERERLSPLARARERLVFGLRRMEGVSRSEFWQQTGFRLDDLAANALQKYAQLGMLAEEGDRVKLTREGLFVSDAIWPDLL